MTTAMRRPAKFAAVLTAAAVLVAGCGSGANTANAAAIIDGRTISVDDIQSRVEKVMQNNTFVQSLQQQRKLDLLSRSILTREVSYELTAVAAQRENLRVDEAAVAQRVEELAKPKETDPAAGAPDPLVAATDQAFDARQVARNELLTEELTKAYLKRLQVTMTVAITTGTEAKKQAQDIAKRLAENPAKATEILAPLEVKAPDLKMSIIGGILLAQQNGFELATSPIFSAPPNTVVAFSLAPHMIQQGQGENQWLIAFVTDRSTSATLTEDELQAASAFTPELLNKVGQRLVGQYVGDIKFEIGPRYGVWDPIGNNVAPRAEEVAGYQYTARVEKP